MKRDLDHDPGERKKRGGNKGGDKSDREWKKGLKGHGSSMN
jgi:hypothetical protein